MADEYTSLCYRIAHYNSCRSTHHKLALDALVQIRGRMAERWRNLLLKNFEAYLEGAKAPDSKFQDFRNHVLHVRDGYWGGAIDAARLWYERLIDLIRRHEWEEAAYAAGVLSHYYTDVIQPLHTAQTEIENQIHRSFEWSVFKSYDALLELIETKLGYPELEVPECDDWLAVMIRQGAEKANSKYDYVVNHFQHGAAIKDPPAGLDRELSKVVAELLAYATIGFSRILEKAFEEAAIRPPRTIAVLTAVMATVKAPLHFIAARVHNAREREIVEGIWNELQETGKVVETLPEDDRVVALLHEREVLGRRPAPPASTVPASTVPARPTLHDPAPARSPNRRASEARSPSVHAGPRGVSSSPAPATPDPRPVRTLDSGRAEPSVEPIATPEPAAESSADPVRKSIFNLSRYVPKRNPRSTEENHADRNDETIPDARTGSQLRYYLQRSDDVEKAPSIGVKTAKRLEKLGVRTVNDLLELDPVTAARQLNVSYIDAELVRDWQTQASLVCRIPNLRGHDAQILVACGFTTPGETASADAEELLLLADEFADTDAGQRVLRGGRRPDLEEVNNWIRWASQARTLQAA